MTTTLSPYFSPAVKQALAILQEGGDLPFIQWGVETHGERVVVSLTFICRCLPYITKFTYDLLSRWTVPGRRVDIPQFFSSEIPGEELMAIEGKLLIDSRTEEEVIRSVLPMLEAELSMGAISFFHASRIMEVKGLTLDEKAAMVQDKITDWVDRNPSLYEFDLIELMQQFFLLSRDPFKAARDVRHLTMLIVTLYAFTKRLSRAIEGEGSRRHLYLKVISATVQSPLSPKRVLGVCVGLNFLRPNEVFEEAHLLSAIKKVIPTAKRVSNSTYIYRPEGEKTLCLYLEIEKGDHSPFDLYEGRELKQKLLDEVRSHIEHLVSPIFMPRNEEEVMRNIVTLSQQLRFVRDLPQVILSFDHQSDTQLHFTLVMVSLKEGLAAALKKVSGEIEFIAERIKKVGFVRKTHPKEAVVLKVRLDKCGFVRDDQSLDLYLARQHVIEQLQRVVGEVRDYNGGMIAKQVENFKALQNLLSLEERKHRFLLENFFHSLFPIEVRALLAPSSMKILFSHLLALHLEKGASKISMKISQDERAVYALLALTNTTVKDAIIAEVAKLNLRWPHLVFLHQHVFETTYLGYILFSEDPSQRQGFLASLRRH